MSNLMKLLCGERTKKVPFWEVWFGMTDFVLFDGYYKPMWLLEWIISPAGWVFDKNPKMKLQAEKGEK